MAEMSCPLLHSLPPVCRPLCIHASPATPSRTPLAGPFGTTLAGRLAYSPEAADAKLSCRSYHRQGPVAYSPKRRLCSPPLPHFSSTSPPSASGHVCAATKLDPSQPTTPGTHTHTHTHTHKPTRTHTHNRKSQNAPPEPPSTHIIPHRIPASTPLHPLPTCMRSPPGALPHRL